MCRQSQGRFVMSQGDSLSAPSGQEVAAPPAPPLQAPFRDSQLVQAIINAALDAVVIFDPRYVIVGWNASAQAVFGWGANEALGRSLMETLIAPAHREAQRKELEKFLAAGEG